MNDLISREEARNLMYHKQEPLTEYDLDSLPTVDAEPVKHGHWIKPTVIDGRAFNIPHCSVCNEVPCGVDEHTNYCPNCGAKMDGVSE